MGLDSVTTVLEEVSEIYSSASSWAMLGYCASIPLQDAPQTAQVKIAFCLPALPSSRLPQSVQKTREPMADIMKDCCFEMPAWEAAELEKKSDRAARPLRGHSRSCSTRRKRQAVRRAKIVPGDRPHVGTTSIALRLDRHCTARDLGALLARVTAFRETMCFLIPP